MSIHCMNQEAVDPSIKTIDPLVFNIKQVEFYAATDIATALKSCADQLVKKIENYQGLGSGWILSSLLSLDTTVWILDPLRASSYHPLPKWIQNTKCVVNLKNNDNLCFKYAVLAGLYEPVNPPVDRVSS